jgi:protein TonB
VFMRTAFKRMIPAVTAVGFILAVAFAEDRPIRVGGSVAQANRISSVAPVYPPEAKEKGIQGTVALDVTIDKEGHVSQITATTGPPELIQSAIDAVSQWVYRPTLLNGEPVTVLTTVNVNYTLTQ